MGVLLDETGASLTTEDGADLLLEGVAPGGTLNQDVKLGGTRWLAVIGIVGTVAVPATAAGDVSVQVLPYLGDGTVGLPDTSETLTPLALPSADSVVAVLSNSRAYVFGRYLVSGLGRVQIQVMNNNAAARPVAVDFAIG